jgi:hypothetical protein
MMRGILIVTALMGGFAMTLGAQDKKKPVALPPDSLYLLKTKTLDGKDADLKDFAGKVTLVVNLASQ